MSNVNSDKPTYSLGLPRWLSGKEPACSAGDAGDTSSFPGLGRSGERHGNPLQYFLPGKSHGQRGLEGYSPQGHKESDTAEATEPHTHLYVFTVFDFSVF